MSTTHSGITGRDGCLSEKLLRPIAVLHSVLLLLVLAIAVQCLAHFTVATGARLQEQGFQPRTAFAANDGKAIVTSLFRHPEIMTAVLLLFLGVPILFRVSCATYVLVCLSVNLLLFVLAVFIVAAITAPTVILPL